MFGCFVKVISAERGILVVVSIFDNCVLHGLIVLFGPR
jgi:hypothetical protein